MGQIPVSRACLCCNLLSNFYCKSRTSCLVAGVAETDWILYYWVVTKVVVFRWYINVEGGLSLEYPRCMYWLGFEDLSLRPTFRKRYFHLLFARIGNQYWV